MYLPARAHRCTSTYAYPTIHVSFVIYVCVWFTMHIAFIRRTTADLSTFIRGLHTHKLAGQHSKAFFFSRPHLFSILKHLISRSELLRGQIPHGRSVLPVGKFRDKFTPREHSRFDKSRRCSSWLPFAFSRTLLIAMTSYITNKVKLHKFRCYNLFNNDLHARSYETIKFK